MTGNFSLYSSVCVEIVAPDPEIIIRKLSQGNVLLEDIVFMDCLTVRTVIQKQDYASARAILESAEISYKIICKQGLLGDASALLRRPVIVLSGMLFLLLLLLLSGRILKIEVTGNSRISSKYILYAAEQSGLRFGCSARTVRSEQTKNLMLSAVPELQWIGITMKGCVATIQVKERDSAPQTDHTMQIGSIVAARDGIVSDIYVRNGSALCLPGQPVQEGEVLISGYTDQGLLTTVTVAEGEIFAFTSREIQAVSLIPDGIVPTSLKKQTRYRLKIGKKVINLFKHSGISDTSCDKMYEEYYMTLPGGFRLPVSLIKESTEYFQLRTLEETHSCAAWLMTEAKAYLTNQMIAGEILQASENLEKRSQCFCFTGVYYCHEMIGKIRYEEILEGYAETN